MSFYMLMLKSAVGRRRGILPRPDKNLVVPNRVSSSLQSESGPREPLVVHENASASTDANRSRDAEQSESVTVSAISPVDPGGMTKRECEALLRWAGWCKSQSIIEASRKARAI